MNAQGRFNKLFLQLSLMICLSILFIGVLSLRARANDGALGMMPDGVYAVNHNDLVMVSETIRVKLESRQVLCEFEFKNTGKDQDVLMGFPAISMEEPEGFTTQDYLTIRNFKAWTKWSPINVFLRDYSSKSLQGMEHFNQYKKWYCFYVHFKENETKTIYHSYDVSFSFDSTGYVSAGYIIRTGALWKGNIGHSKIIFDFENLPICSLEYFSPTQGYRFEGNTLVWENSDYEPSSNLSVSYNSFRYSDRYLDIIDYYGYGEMEPDRLAKIELFNTPIDAFYRFKPDYIRLYHQYITRKPVQALYLKSVLRIDDSAPDIQMPEKDLKTADEFVQMIIKALNENDIPVLIKYYDSVYGETTPDKRKLLIDGLILYHRYFEGEEIVGYEFGRDLEAQYDTPDTTGKQYYLISQSGIRRDIMIKTFGKDEVTFKFNDPLLFYGPKVVSSVDNYINAIKSEDVGYLYDHCIGSDDPGKEPYSDSNHIEEYERIAKQAIEDYKEAFNLKTIRYEMTGNISEVCNFSALSIEFNIIGTSPDARGVSHIIHGVYEFPMWGVNDPWLWD